MAATNHGTTVYIGLGGEGPLIVGTEGPPVGVGGLYRRTDGEQEWQSISNGLPEQPQIRALAVHPNNPQVIYAGTQEGVYRSDDKGDHWESTQSPKGDVWSMAFHPSNSDVLMAGYDRGTICRSDDAGETWRTANSENVVFPHITMHPNEIVKRVLGLAFDPAHPQDVYGAVEVGGLMASRDGGENWESITDGHYVRLGPVDLHGVQVNPTAAGLVYIITQLAMFRSRDRGRRWELVSIEEMFPGGSYCRDLTVAPDNPQVMYLAAGAGGGAAPPGTQEAGALYRSRDAGETWERLDLGEVPPSRMSQVAVDPASPSHLYCCTNMGEVFSSYDEGDTWSKSLVPGEVSRARHVYRMTCG